MDPLYTPENTTPAYQLNWGLTIFWRQAPIPKDRWLPELTTATEPDGVRILKHRTTPRDGGQFFVSTRPHVSPGDLIRSVKGRLQHAIAAERPKAFRRNYALRSVGAAKRSVVEDYVAEQFGHHRMADASVQRGLTSFQRNDPDVDLRKPAFSSHGEYWYNLHLVFVNEQRWMEIREDVWERIGDMIDRTASKHGDRLSRVGLLADHVHLVMGCRITRSPQDVALAYLNNCAYVCGMKSIFRMGYYVGTVGEYDRGAV